MNKHEYIIKQIAKTNKKNYENYVVTRIWHLINRLDIKFKTQQYVSRPSGHALTDLYFPQLKLHIEVDEPFHEKQKVLDIKRESEIIEATSHCIKRIKITNNLENVNRQIDLVLADIRKEISNQEKKGTFEPWEFGKEYKVEYHLAKGYLDVTEDPSFRKIGHACNVLGQNYHENTQRTYVESKQFPGHFIWLPKFFENDLWDNNINNDGTIITERSKQNDERQAHYEKSIRESTIRIVFPKCIDNLGDKLYKFKGIFEIDKKNSDPITGIKFNRTKTKIILPSNKY